MSDAKPVFIATRGSALALAQANAVLAQCREAFSQLQFELKIIKTTGDKLQTASMVNEGLSLPKGLFTKELEVALLNHEADLAVHSLKDLPTELPSGLTLGAVGKRADVRDVLIYRDAAYLKAKAPGDARSGFGPKLSIPQLPPTATVGTCSTRRKSQLIHYLPKLKIVELRGNVGTRLQKLFDRPELDATILAAAGLSRLHFKIAPDGHLTGEGVPEGLFASLIEPEAMLPCVGQGAVGIEIREHDERISTICEKLNDHHTRQCVTAERAFLAAMGGGCQSPVGAYAEIVGSEIRMRAVSFRDGPARHAEAKRPIAEAKELGCELAEKLK
jgi:hydroxymethylbilane synthase